ncbi:vomeronasal type-2 receptor 26-like [Protopterus annectens]|uniref:vomeronasal type-2 receptor 26-like n=1 Tax=Protopterus annectens TaxID=7888 RepID=UPI001CFBDFEF|nr:vomeronasal type-2 receptor 26-like [Protopterus annectens]
MKIEYGCQRELYIEENVAEANNSSVWNISPHTLTVEEMSLLNKGMNFIPTQPSDITDCMMDLKLFTQTVMLKVHFKSNNNVQCDSHIMTFKKPSSFTRINNAAVEVFERKCEDDIISLFTHRNLGKVFFFNLIPYEQQALKMLIHDRSIVIKSADKGSPVVPHSMCSETCSLGYRKSSRQGQPLCCYDCVLCSMGEIANQTDTSDCLKCPAGFFSNDRRDACVPKLIEFLSLQESLGCTLALVAIILAAIPLLILWIFIGNRDTPIVKANNRDLSYFLLVSLTLCFLCSLIFIGKPNNISCLMRQMAFGIFFSISVSSVLTKTIIVVIAFNATKPGSKLLKWVGSKTACAIVTCGTLIQIIICTVWLISFPPFPQLNSYSYKEKIIIECNENSIAMFYCMLGYLGFLATVSLIVAFLARKLPDSFNEAKFITFSMLVFVSVWLSFIPAYMSTKGKFVVAVEVFALLSSTAGSLSCIFFPKCYIIILRPEMNTRDYLRKRDANMG